MLTRLAIAEDEDAVVELAGMQVRETLPHLDFSEAITRDTFRQAVSFADPTIFVVEEDRKVIGYLMALLNGYAFTDGIYVVQEVLYVHPDKRGTRAAASLLKEFIRWGERLEAKEIIFGVSNNFQTERAARSNQHQTERTARFFEHLGAHRVGYYLKKVRG